MRDSEVLGLEMELQYLTEFALIVPEESTDEHLQILAVLAKMLSNKKNIEALRQSKNPKEIFAILTN